MIFLFLCFTVLPALELYLLFKVGSLIGGLETIAVILVTGILGAAAAKSQGERLLWRIQQKLQEGELPADSMIEGFIIFAGGLLLVTPGFVTDAMGLAALFPWSRRVFLQLFRLYLAKKVKQGQFRMSFWQVRTSDSSAPSRPWRDVTPSSIESSPKGEERDPEGSPPENKYR